ncbi:TPA: hypothetical protein N0F65_009178 [Lagenidium giganteum]|uniref:Uncharacterized protein n=1 Tax=Lagenidium giganteum TaxID=4803 RepID=A0AAV2YTH8_9STRA|nr:TPA: hypothetical protein N0F65_009178 [Lagenidium giganteum]
MAVSMAPSTRGDVLRFQDMFVELLDEQQARSKAICPVREKLFLQVFDELIRQVTCECPERGLLLLRVRDELRLTIEAYQTLYHNSIAYGRQKAVQAEAGTVELEADIHRLERERAALLTSKHKLTHRVLDQLEEERRRRSLQHDQTLQFLRTQRGQLEAFHRELSQDASWK